MTSVLDQFGQAISTREMKRIGDAPRRQLRAKYDAVQISNENRRHWANSDGLAPDSALDPEVRRKLRNHARYETANDTYCSGMISTLANDTIGSGPSLQMLTGNKTVDSQVELAFWKWMQAIRLPQKLRTMRRAKAVDGEAFGSMFTNRQLRNPVRVDLQLHEAEMIANPFLALSTDPSDGIIFDDFGNVVGYRLLQEHPGTVNGTILATDEADLVPAQDMIHLFNADRPGQHRGAPEITPALPLFALRRRYVLAVLRAAESAAIPSWVVKTQSSPDDPENLEPMDTLDFERGMGLVLPAGWDIGQFDAKQPQETFEMFTKAIIREVARCLNMPFNVAAGDSSGYNYASGRMDHQVYFKSIDVERRYIEETALEALFNAWFLEARAVGGLLPAPLRGSRELPEHSWRWDGREHVDPEKEANASKTLLESNQTTLADLYAKKGQDWEEQLQQIAREKALMKELGIAPAEEAPAGFGGANAN